MIVTLNYKPGEHATLTSSFHIQCGNQWSETGETVMSVSPGSAIEASSEHVNSVQCSISDYSSLSQWASEIK